MVLVLITVTTLSVAGFARKSLELATIVADAQEDLQRRWATKSCQRLVLKNAESVLESRATSIPESSHPWPMPAAITLEFQLGGLQFDLDLTDEEAKVSLNALAMQDTDPYSRLSWLSGASGLMNSIRWPKKDVESKRRVAFLTWEQVFDLSQESNSQEAFARLKANTTEMTCWGSGKLNLRRASDLSVRVLCVGAASEEGVQRLLAERRTAHAETLDEMLNRISIKPGDKFALKRFLTTESKCHALWLTVRSHRRSWMSLTIDPSGKGNHASFETFTW